MEEKQLFSDSQNTHHLLRTQEQKLANIELLLFSVQNGITATLL